MFAMQLRQNTDDYKHNKQQDIKVGASTHIGKSNIFANPLSPGRQRAKD